MNFQSRDSYSNPLFKSSHILKLEDKIKHKILIENILLNNKSFNNLLPPIFNSWIIFGFDVHNYQQSHLFDKILKPPYRMDS